MASQPLETIPEDPTPAPTPPNSPTPARVTANPPQTKPAKNPGHVESGKRLAERNRLEGRPRKRHKLRSQALPQPQPQPLQPQLVTTAASRS